MVAAHVVHAVAVLALAIVLVRAQHDDLVRIPCRDPNNFDPSACLFAGDHCDFNANFSLFYDQAMPYHKYVTNPSPDLAEFIVEGGAPRIQDGGAGLSVPLIARPPMPGLATVVSTTRFLHYGVFEATFKVPGRGGTVASFIGYSNDRDEIDLEITGYDNTTVQANWYYRGKADIFASNGSSVNGYIIKTATSTADLFHTYTLNWTPESISWSINGQLMHRSTKADNGQKGFPDSPMRISFGLWQAQEGSSWAGKFDQDWLQAIATQFTSFRVSCLDGPHNVSREKVSSDQLAHPPTGYNPDNPNGYADSSKASPAPSPAPPAAISMLLNLVLFGLGALSSLFSHS